MYLLENYRIYNFGVSFIITDIYLLELTRLQIIVRNCSYRFVD